MSDKIFEYPEQTKAVYDAMKYLMDKNALSEDPLNVEMTREGYKPVNPCSRGVDKLDLRQLEEAKKEGKWWFIGPIKSLRITNVRRSRLSQADVDLLKRITEEAKISLSLK